MRPTNYRIGARNGAAVYSLWIVMRYFGLSLIRPFPGHESDWAAEDARAGHGLSQKPVSIGLSGNPALSVSSETLAPVSTLLGYARVSTADQNPDLQSDALSAAGCFKVWTDIASGAKTDRPELAALMDVLRPGDTLVVWRLDRLGRSLPHLIETVTDLEQRGVAFRSLTESIDTSTAGGRLIFHIFGALADFERSLIKERTVAGLAAARERGRVGGRPAALTPAKTRQAKKMRAEGVPMSEIAEVLEVARSTLYLHLG